MEELKSSSSLHHHDYIYCFIPNSRYRCDGIYMKELKKGECYKLMNIGNGKLMDFNILRDDLSNLYLRSLTPIERKGLNVVPFF